MKRTVTLSIVLVSALVLAACGSGTGSAARVDRTVEITMKDIAFSPESVMVAKGETVRFVFRNTGKLVHDAFVGDVEAQRGHERDMREQGKDDGHDDDHGDGGNAVTVKPGKTGELVHTFDEDVALEIGCHQPGHYESGMKTAIEVTA